jgi:hypothetical protein
LPGERAIIRCSSLLGKLGAGENIDDSDAPLFKDGVLGESYVCTIETAMGCCVFVFIQFYFARTPWLKSIGSLI